MGKELVKSILHSWEIEVHFSEFLDQMLSFLTDTKSLWEMALNFESNQWPRIPLNGPTSVSDSYLLLFPVPMAPHLAPRPSLQASSTAITVNPWTINPLTTRCNMLSSCVEARKKFQNLFFSTRQTWLVSQHSTSDIICQTLWLTQTIETFSNISTTIKWSLYNKWHYQPSVNAVKANFKHS